MTPDVDKPNRTIPNLQKQLSVEREEKELKEAQYQFRIQELQDEINSLRDNEHESISTGCPQPEPGTTSVNRVTDQELISRFVNLREDIDKVI